MKVVVVGVCASGKTTLVNSLKEFGIDAYNVAQEHSVIQRLWKRKNPDIVVVLDATLPIIKQRREIYWGEEGLLAQHERLKDAKLHANLYIQTDILGKKDVLQKVLTYIGRQSYD